MKKYPVTDRLDAIVKESGKLIDSYQAYEKELTNLRSFIRNYVNEKIISEKHQKILSIKEKFEIISTDFKEFKREHRSEFSGLMQEYLDKYEEYLAAVFHSMNIRIQLQDTLLAKDGNLLSNISLMRDMGDAIDLCLYSGLEVNEIASQILQKNLTCASSGRAKGARR